MALGKTLTASYILDAAALSPGIAAADAELSGLEDSSADLSAKVDGHTKAMGDAFKDMGAGIGADVGSGIGDAKARFKDLDDAGKNLASDMGEHTSKIGSAFKSLGESLGNFGIPFSGSVTKMGESMDKTSAKSSSLVGALSNIGKVATVGLTAGVLAFGAASVKMSVDFQSSVDSMAASGNMTIAQAQKIGNAFLDMGGQTEFSGGEMVKAYGPVAEQLATVEGHTLSAAQAVQVETAAADLATASHSSLSSTTSDLASVMQAYGLKANEAANASNILWTTSTMTGNGLDSVATMAQKLHTQMGNLTPPLSQVGTLMVSLAAHGETGRGAISAVNSALTSLVKPVTANQTAISDLNAITAKLPPNLQALAKQYESGSISSEAYTAALKTLTPTQATLMSEFSSAATKVQSSKTALDELGISVTNSKGGLDSLGTIFGELHDKIKGETQAQQMAAVTQVFGAGASRKLLDVIDAGPAAWSKEEAAVTKANAAKEAAAKASQALDVQLKVIGSAIVDEGTKFGNFLIPKLEDVGKVLVDVAGFFEHSKVAAIALGVAVGGPLLAAMAIFAAQTAGNAVRAVTQFSSKLIHLPSTLGAAARGANEAEDANAALNTTLGNLNQTLSQMTDQLSSTGAAISDFSDTESAQAGAASAASDANEQLALSFGAVEEASAPVIAAMSAVEDAEDSLAATSEATGEASSAAFGPIGIAIMGLVTVGELVVTHWKTISRDIMIAWDDVFGFAKKIFGDLEDFFKKWGEDILLAFAPIVGIPLFLATHWREVEHDAKDIWGDITNFFTSIPSKIFGGMESGLSSGFSAVSNFFSSIPSKIESAFSGAGSWLLNVGKDVLGGMASGLSAGFSAVGNFFGSIGSKIEGFFSDAGSWLLQAGKDIVKGLWTGFEYLTPVGLVIKFHNQILGALSDAGSWLLKSGEDVMKGMWNGIVKGWDAVGDFGKWLSHEILDGLKDAGTWLVDVGKDVVKGLAKGIKDGGKIVEDEVKHLGSDVVGWAKDVWHVFSPSQVFAEIGSNLVEGLAQGITNSKQLATAAMDDVDVVTKLSADVITFRQTMSTVAPAMNDAIAGVSGFGTALNAVEAQLSSSSSGMGANLKVSMHNVGVAMAQGLIDGIADSQGAIDQTMVNIGTALLGTMKNTLGVHSPSTLFAAIGSDTLAGLKQGIDRGTSSTVDAMTGVARQIASVPFTAPNVTAGAITGSGVAPGDGTAATGTTTTVINHVVLQVDGRQMGEVTWQYLLQKGLINGSAGQLSFVKPT